MKILEKGAMLLHVLGWFRKYPEKVSSHFLVSTKKYLSDPQKIYKNIAIQDFLRNLPVLSKLQKQTMILNFLHTIKAPIVQQLILWNYQ